VNNEIEWRTSSKFVAKRHLVLDGGHARVALELGEMSRAVDEFIRDAARKRR
jgi:hypothetical protein